MKRILQGRSEGTISVRPHRPGRWPARVRCASMVHLRIVLPHATTEAAMDVLCGTDSVCNVILLEHAARRPDGDVILCDVAREDASVVLEDLKALDIHNQGSIALEVIDTQLSRFADHAEKHAKGAPAARRRIGIAAVEASERRRPLRKWLCAAVRGTRAMQRILQPRSERTFDRRERRESDGPLRSRVGPRSASRGTAPGSCEGTGRLAGAAVRAR